MSEVYAYEIVDGIVIRGIVGTAEGAMRRNGGFWVDSDTLAWVGGTWDEINGFQPPVSTEEII